MSIRINFRQSKMCWYCKHNRHSSCTIRFPTTTNEHECICWVWAGRKRHIEEVTNEDDAIINILGSLGA